MYSRVYVEITNICNMSCSFCHGHKREPKRMSEYEFERVLLSLEGKTRYIYYHVMGEPLTHPLLPSFIKLAGERGFKSVVTTNGTLLGKRGDELISSGVYKVNISLHSFEEGSDEMYDKYIGSVIEFAQKASNAGIIVVLRLWNRGFDGGRNDSAYDMLKKHIAGEWIKNTRGIRIHDKLHLEWGERFEWPDMAADVQGDDVFCYGLRDHFGILCDGSVIPCCMDSEGVISLGNVFEEDLSDILSSKRARAIADGFDKRCAYEPLCQRCGYAQRFK
ncbi:MAG: radical SAM protein [Clostridia bacterium]|nr:radical SAM protein [Clostridia bacterium]